MAVDPHRAVPKAPEDVSAAVDSATQVALTWADASANEDGFIVEQSTGGGGGAYAIASGTLSRSGDAMTYVVPDLTTGTVYEFRVRSTNSVGSSDWVGTGSFTPSADPPTGQPPSAPAIRFEQLHPALSDLAWEAVPGVSEYRVEVRYPSAPDPDTWHRLPNVGGVSYDGGETYAVPNTTDKWWLRPDVQIRVRSVQDGLASTPSRNASAAVASSTARPSGHP